MEAQPQQQQQQHRWAENIFQEEEHSKIGEVLVNGRELTRQLKTMLENKPPLLPLPPPPHHRNNNNPSSLSPDQLLNNILLSFTNTISILTSPSPSSSEDSSQKASPPHPPPKKSDHSLSSDTLVSKERRGCYKRRRTTQTWMRTTPTLVDDGFAWRKYGQKVILNAKHPRNYYRCTHKFDQGCMATKQVQKTDTEPEMYQVTYSGSHCCNNILGSPHIIIDSDEAAPPSSSNSILLSFTKNDDHKSFFSTPITSLGASNYQDSGGGHVLNSCSEQYRYLHFSSAIDNEGLLPGLASSGGVSSGVDVLVDSVDFYDDLFDF